MVFGEALESRYHGEALEQHFMDHLQLWNKVSDLLANAELTGEVKKRMREIRRLAAFPNDRFREKHQPNVKVFGIVPEIALEGKRVKRSAFIKAESRLKELITPNEQFLQAETKQQELCHLKTRISKKNKIFKSYTDEQYIIPDSNDDLPLKLLKQKKFELKSYRALK
jgi:hypothetical protein